MNFEGKTAMITGAATGIGRAVAIQMAQKGANVILLDTDAEKLQNVATELQKYDAHSCYFVCDVRDETKVNEIAEEAKKIFGGVDILVNNAALWRHWDNFVDIKTEEWRKFIDVNIMGVVHCTKAVLPGMLEKRYGRIINVASVAGVYGNAEMVHYSATKGAVIAMTRALAKEVTAQGVLVNAVSPGSVSPAEKTDMDYFEPSELSFMGRTGTDRENANLICFLASDDAGYISGQNIQIDGCRKKQ